MPTGYLCRRWRASGTVEETDHLKSTFPWTMVGCVLGLALGLHPESQERRPAAGEAFIFPSPVIEWTNNKQKLYSRKLT